jgi:hypothetical protein
VGIWLALAFVKNRLPLSNVPVVLLAATLNKEDSGIDRRQGDEPDDLSAAKLASLVNLST